MRMGAGAEWVVVRLGRGGGTVLVVAGNRSEVRLLAAFAAKRAIGFGAVVEVDAILR